MVLDFGGPHIPIQRCADLVILSDTPKGVASMLFQVIVRPMLTTARPWRIRYKRHTRAHNHRRLFRASCRFIKRS